MIRLSNKIHVKETDEILNDTELMKQIEGSLRDVRDGKILNLDELKEVLCDKIVIKLSEFYLYGGNNDRQTKDS